MEINSDTNLLNFLFVLPCKNTNVSERKAVPYGLIHLAPAKRESREDKGRLHHPAAVLLKDHAAAAFTIFLSCCLSTTPLLIEPSGDEKAEYHYCS